MFIDVLRGQEIYGFGSSKICIVNISNVEIISFGDFDFYLFFYYYWLFFMRWIDLDYFMQMICQVCGE